MLTRTISETVNYSGDKLVSASYTETGDTEVQVNESVAAGASVTFPAAITAANVKAIAVHVTPDTADVDTSAADELIAAGNGGVLAYAESSHETNPITTDATSITVDNTAGAESVSVKIYVLLDT